jgi:predicted RNase H-like HicB family nuclease
MGMTLKAIVHTAEEGGFWAEVPALPGCTTQGETEEEIHANLLEAVELWLEVGEASAAPATEGRVLELAL